jgi:hypothetical protein
MTKNISILLPGSFFEEKSKEKLTYLSNKKIGCIYLFDHSINPADDRKAVYQIKKALSQLQHNNDYEFGLGVCVLNINRRKKDLLFSQFINPMMEIKDFRLGLGTGDTRYEKNNSRYSNDLELIITDLINQYSFSIDERNLFVGGTSKHKLDLVNKYSIGINQWLGNSQELISIHKGNLATKPFIGRFSQCLTIRSRSIDLPKSFEKIFVLKDSNVAKFYSDVDKILS